MPKTRPMDLSQLAQIAEIVGVVTIVFGLIFGLAQLRQFRQQRRDTAAVELMRSIQDREFTRAYRIVYALPTDVSAAALRERGEEAEDAAMTIGAKFETIGLLVFRQNIPLDIVEELIGAGVIDFWNRCQPWVHDMRKENSQPLILEWFQWLAERLQERGRAEQKPAYVRFRNWSGPR